MAGVIVINITCLAEFSAQLVHEALCNISSVRLDGEDEAFRLAALDAGHCEN
jgi:hypothetical protein